MLNRKTLFAYCRRAPFGGQLLQSQVEGVECILDAWNYSGATDLRWLAYILATALHETASTMQPIAEYGRGKGKKYGIKGKYGQVPYGRGFVQLTWDANYERADKELGLGGKLTKNFDLAMDPAIAAKIIVTGMIEGWFTSKRLSQYFNTKADDPVGARGIVNGKDKAKLIAGYYEAFLGALKAADTDTPQPKDVTADAAKPDDVKPQESKSLWAIISTFITGTGISAFTAIESWQGVAALALLLIAAGIGVWLVATGRVQIKRLLAGVA